MPPKDLRKYSPHQSSLQQLNLEAKGQREGLVGVDVHNFLNHEFELFTIFFVTMIFPLLYLIHATNNTVITYIYFW